MRCFLVAPLKASVSGLLLQGHITTQARVPGMLLQERIVLKASVSGLLLQEPGN